jgi:hypothetical protein
MSLLVVNATLCDVISEKKYFNEVISKLIQKYKKYCFVDHYMSGGGGFILSNQTIKALFIH